MKLGIHYRQELASALPSDPNWLRLETQLSRSRSTTRPPSERVARSSRRLLPVSDQHRLPSVVGWTTASHWRLAPDCGPMVGFALPPRRRCGCGLPLRLLASSEEKPRRDAGEPMIRLRLRESSCLSRLSLAAACSRGWCVNHSNTHCSSDGGRDPDRALDFRLALPIMSIDEDHRDV